MCLGNFEQFQPAPPAYTGLSSRNQRSWERSATRPARLAIEGLPAEVVLSADPQHATAKITAYAVRELDLRPGDAALVLVKAA